MTKYNMNIVSHDMKARLEFMMNIYNRLIMSDKDVIPHKTAADYRSLNGYIKLMQCATYSKKNKKLNKTRLCRSAGASRATLAQKNYKKNYSR